MKSFLEPAQMWLLRTEEYAETGGPFEMWVDREEAILLLDLSEFDMDDEERMSYWESGFALGLHKYLLRSKWTKVKEIIWKVGDKLE